MKTPEETKEGFYVSEDGEWIPEGWTICKLGDYITEIAMGPFGSNLKVEMFTDSGVPVIKGQNLTTRYVSGEHSYVSEEKADSLRKSVAYPDDFIVTHRGTIGQVSLIRGTRFRRYVTSQSQLRFTVDGKSLDNEFLLSWFHTVRGQHELLRNSSQVGVPAIASPTSSIKDINLIRPPLSEQKAIAAVLGSLDDKIELLREQNETLEALAQTLFRRWFIDFNFPDKNGNPYKDSGGKMIVSELGEIPEEWKADKLNDYISISGGGTPSTKEPSYWDGEIAWSSPKDLSARPDAFLFQTNKTITTEGLGKISSGLNPVGSLLLSSRAPIGYIAFADTPVAVNQGYIVFAPEQYLSNQFMFLWLKKYMSVVTNAANGSTFLEISKKAFKEIETIIPCEGVLQGFQSLMMPQFEKLRSNLIQIRTLTQLRNTLLPKLMKGEIRVPFET